MRIENAIPKVSDAKAVGIYPTAMPKTKDLRWIGWGERLRKAARDRRKCRQDIADHMEVSYAQVGHWQNGTRDIYLGDLMKLCEFVDVDPAVILFGGPAVPADAPLAVKQAVEILAKIRTVAADNDKLGGAEKPNSG
jgi:transcriptional regulator with XRE-family HTH domain